jgi:fatty-acyl-CoA synthase
MSVDEHLDPGLTVPALLRRWCERHADRTALVFEGEAWTYRRLHGEVLEMQAALLALGAGKGTRIALLMSGRPEWVVTAFAAMGIGAVVVPVSTYEPAAQRERLLRHADAAILVLQDTFLRNDYLGDLLRDHPGLASDEPLHDEALPYLRHVIHVGDGPSTGRVLAWGEALRRAPAPPAGYLSALEAQIHPTDDALIVYTSGTSGAAKGVLHAHRGLAIQFDRLPEQFSITADDVVWGTYPLFWSAGIAWVLGASLAAGAALVMQERFAADEALDLIETHRVTVVQATPLHCSELEEALVARDDADLSSIRILPRGTLSKRLGIPADAPFAGASLGLTETLTLATSIPWDAPVQLRLTTNGRALPGTQVDIVDPATGERLPVGEQGEIALKGTTLMKGYNKVFPETYLDDRGYYRTGDAGSLDEDGYLHWTGRLSQLIRTSSANVSPGEVEEALYHLPGVKIAAALGAPDPDYGEIVVACVVPRPGAVLTEADVQVQLKERLASYKVPRHVLFLEEAELDLTATGKARLSGLATLVAQRLGLGEATSTIPPS